MTTNLDMTIDEAEKCLLHFIGKSISARNPKDKGWRGQELEKLLGNKKRDNVSAPDSFSFELKSAVCRIGKDGVLRPIEKRIAICMIREDTLKVPFIQSECWRKMQRMLIVGISNEGKWATSGKILFVRRLIFQDDKNKFSKLEQDYIHLQRLSKRKGFNNLSRTDLTSNGFLQIASKGTGGAGRPRTKAVYLLNKAM